MINILIVEDEPPIAADIRDYVSEFCHRMPHKITVLYTFEEARVFLKTEKIDLLLLDLNLSGQNGFDILEETAARNFHTIIVSAYTERALEAYNYGVLDFVSKPIDRKRLKLAFERFFDRGKREGKTAKYLVVHKFSQHFPIPIASIHYFKAARYLVEIHLDAGGIELIEKSLNNLEFILPTQFVRVHRSYIVNITLISSYCHLGGGAYQITLKNGTIVPLSGKRRKTIEQIMNNKHFL
jgi:two-component system response regulator LytT